MFRGYSERARTVAVTMEKQKRDASVGAALVETDREPVAGKPRDEVSSAESERDDAPTPAHTDEKPRGPKRRKATNVRKLRLERMMSKAEMARRANLSVLTIDRIEKGYGCRMDTKRKILEALGLSLEDRVKVFGEDD